MSSDREICFKILNDVINGGRIATEEISSTDGVTDFVVAAVYGTITYMTSIDFLIELASGKDTASMDDITAVIIRLGAWQILFSDKVPDYAAVNSSVELARHHRRSSTGFVNAVLRKVAALPAVKRDINRYKPEVATSLPSEIFGIIKKSYGRERALSIGKAFLKTPEITIRFDPSKISRAELIQKLEKDDFTVRDAQFMEEALVIVPGRVPLDKAKAFADGDFFVQGESAMLASRAADPQIGQRILDCCSAPGGKTTHMAQLAGDECEITALDKSSARLVKMKENIDRLGLRSIRFEASDSATYSTDKPYDTVLADVPCSGIGLLAKKPEIRLRLKYQRVVELLDIQRAIIDNISECVKPGGTLIYSTCSINRAENEEQVEAFLDRHEDFYADDITPFIPGRLIIDGERQALARKGMITLLPDTDECDGFFIARLKRRTK